MAMKETQLTFISAFKILFYLSKVHGIITFSFSDFYKYKILKLSNLGIVWSLISVIYHGLEYHFISVSVSYYDRNDETKRSALTTGIAIVLNYIGPLMMFIDIIMSIINAKKIILIFEHFKITDERLQKNEIFIDNCKLKKRIIILIISLSSAELINYLLIYFTTCDYKSLKSLLSLLSNAPFIINILDKVWFTSFLYALRQRFEFINNYLDNIVDEYGKQINYPFTYYNNNDDNLTSNIDDDYDNDDNTIITTTKNVTGTGINDNEHFKNNFDINFGYLHKEIVLKSTSFKIVPSNVRRNNHIIPVLPWNGKKFKKPSVFKENILNNTQKIQNKLNTICQLHDELCEIGKTINGMWSLQMLFLMAYGFIGITAKFYFFYCSIVGENVPNLFRPATNIYVVIYTILLIASKCVYIIFLSWKTKLESRRTGIGFHKCGLAVDENKFYEIINHLSLKLLNHSVNFNACGFFNLDMTTLFAVIGAITSYLIILIQFNLATHPQARSSEKQLITTTTTTATTLIPNMTSLFTDAFI